MPSHVFNNPDNKVHGANVVPIWGPQDPGTPHVGPTNFAIWERLPISNWTHRNLQWNSETCWQVFIEDHENIVCDKSVILPRGELRKSLRVTKKHQLWYLLAFNVINSSHDDVIKWKHFPRYWPFVRVIHRSRWIPHTKASDADLWCFLWSGHEQTVE